MAKKDFANLTADLSALAANMPTQRPTVVSASPTVPVAPPPPAEQGSPPRLAVVAQVAATEAASVPVTQFSLRLRKELHKQLGRLASDADVTMRAFVLTALKEKGLAVTEDDLKDLRRERPTDA